MKRIILIVGIVAILFLGIFNREAIASSVQNIVYQTPCAAPRTYSIGTVDPRFNLTKDQILLATEQAGYVWKNADGKPLFTYDPESKLTINFVYDRRQQLNTTVNTLNDKVETQKNSLKPEIAVYEQRAAAFKKRNTALNERINYWNNKGGAPEDEYAKLLEEQKSLQNEAQQLQAMATSLNQSTDDYNTQVHQLDQQVSEFNKTLTQEPEEGEYIRNGKDEKIVIYIVNSQQELLHTLSHEMGHAIGINHNNDPLSIMYPKTNDITALSPEDTASLAEVCRKRSILETAGEKLTVIADNIKSATNHFWNNDQTEASQ